MSIWWTSRQLEGSSTTRKKKKSKQIKNKKEGKSLRSEVAINQAYTAIEMTEIHDFHADIDNIADTEP
jgi:hypothetical protein